MALFRRKKDEPEVLDPEPETDLEALAEVEVDGSAKWLVAVLDRAARVQTTVVEKHVDRLKRKNPDADAAELQAKLDKQFRNAVTGTGASSGGASAIPGIGFVTGAVAIGAESVVFVDFVVAYTMASAYLRGIDIRDPRERRTIVLVSLLGSKGSVVIDTLLPDGLSTTGLPAVASLSRLSGPTLNEVNNRLVRTALKSVSKRIRRAWLGKLLPMGVGLVVGSVANRKLAAHVIEHTNEALGPARFGEGLPRGGVIDAEPDTPIDAGASDATDAEDAANAADAVAKADAE
ncbi:hypothetical protein QP119_00870 [Corynebacterium frankenforstense]|uniref:hypothetical protein n=1 Tax=Corynebacterium TaxID=1716 RepID=UPI00254BA73E|nr:MULTISPECIES: hypothetical protein [Corynebacterium]MDK6258987.1 hypothetical protein [Corynebacterium frankenforstense]MDK8894631.1 hypothetical protein [Corynebacterium sp. MSK006]